ncbi:MAG: hypothetical protein HQ567_34015 [Candidatus Nealsonbacteria bacterium]|nr:hypothetical protein [Candidatus Nealsonbacteria bacterium]
MTDSSDNVQLPARRAFLRKMSATAASGLALGAVARADDPPAENAKLPTIKLGKYDVTRLVAGWNPIGGHSHTTLNMARVMREYFTVEQTAQFLLDCEQHGINTWQYDHTEKGVAALRLAREKGSKIQPICLHAERSLDAPLKQVIEEAKPIAIVHHGGVTDAMFRAGRSHVVRNFVKLAKDQGLVVGVSSHCPDNIKQIADEGWENDFFLTCFYYVSRPREEQEETMGKVIVGEPFLQSDPEEMTAVVRQVDKPCLGFKILAAGRLGWSRFAVEKAFKFAFANIKPTDGVIVGIFPKYYDEIADNAKYTLKHGADA